jgi:hypothetical protein
MNMMDKQYQNDLNLLNAQNGVGGTKSTIVPPTTMLPKSFGFNTPNIKDVNIGTQLNPQVQALSMLQGATLSNFNPGIGKNMLGMNQQSLADYQEILKQIKQNKGNFYSE